MHLSDYNYKYIMHIVMDSVEAKYYNSEGFLTAIIAVLREQTNIENV